MGLLGGLILLKTVRSISFDGQNDRPLENG